ncbi:hypothetical protein LCGC14_1797670 [marine sediment metagenome]|uniref:Uncharacterized protein n=1 Tax=marine sediment metagenome TaxID=412755 RepID=A0A0F9JQ38_9ZZZZ
MVSLSEAQITGIVTLALILSGAVVVGIMEKSYYCASEDNVKECLRLSSSGITCYYLLADDISKGDRCTGGVWKNLQSSVPKEKISEIESTTIIGNNCLKDGKYCYCNPRGLLKNKELCQN